MRTAPRLPRRIAPFLMATLLLGACASTPRTSVVRSPEADFTTFDSFAFHEPLGTDRSDGMDSILSQTLRQVARQELEARGYRFDPDDPDLRVNFFVESKEVIEGVNRPDPYVRYGFYHRYYGVWSDYETRIHQFTLGTLHVDLIDAAREQLVWEGIVRQPLPEDDFTYQLAELRSGLARVFAEFPRR